MAHQQATARRRTVQRQFEPNRLAFEIMVRAYAQVIPGHVRVIAAEPGEDEPAAHLPARPGLVIGPITNEEVA